MLCPLDGFHCPILLARQENSYLSANADYARERIQKKKKNRKETEVEKGWRRPFWPIEWKPSTGHSTVLFSSDDGFSYMCICALCISMCMRIDIYVFTYKRVDTYVHV